MQQVRKLILKLYIIIKNVRSGKKGMWEKSLLILNAIVKKCKENIADIRFNNINIIIIIFK